MTIQIIPIEPEEASEFSQIVPLEGQDYIFNFSWNSRDEHWYLSLEDVDGVAIQGCTGYKLVDEASPLRRSTDEKKPPGELVYTVELANDDRYEALGTTSILAYFEEEDLE